MTNKQAALILAVVAIVLVVGYNRIQNRNELERARAVENVTPDVSATADKALEEYLAKIIRKENRTLVVRDRIMNSLVTVRAITSYEVSCMGDHINIDMHLGSAGPLILINIGRDLGVKTGVRGDSVAADRLCDQLSERARMYLAKVTADMAVAPPVLEETAFMPDDREGISADER